MGPEVIYAPTADGWRLAICHWPAQGEPRNYPVLMVHGLGANRLNLDLDERYSIARAAARRGFDVFVLELRGAGLSRAPHGRDRSRYQWGFGDFSELDMPAAIDLVLSRTGAKALHGLGHSMGGMLFLCEGTKGHRNLRSITAVGAPHIRKLDLGRTERRLMALATKISPDGVQRQVPIRKILGAAGRFIHLSKRLVNGLLLNTENTTDDVMSRMSKEGIDNIPLQLVFELSHQMSAPSETGPLGFESRLDRIDVPVLVLSGSVDRVAPPSSVKATVDQLKVPDLRYRQMGKAFGDRADYGHIDLLVGRNAPDEVFPVLLDFLEEVD